MFQSVLMSKSVVGIQVEIDCGCASSFGERHELSNRHEAALQPGGSAENESLGLIIRLWEPGRRLNTPVVCELEGSVHSWLMRRKFSAYGLPVALKQ